MKCPRDSANMKRNGESMVCWKCGYEESLTPPEGDQMTSISKTEEARHGKKEEAPAKATPKRKDK